MLKRHSVYAGVSQAVHHIREDVSEPCRLRPKVVLEWTTCMQVEYRPFTVSERLPVSPADWRRKEGGLLSKVLRNQAKGRP